MTWGQETKVVVAVYTLSPLKCKETESLPSLRYAEQNTLGQNTWNVLHLRNVSSQSSCEIHEKFIP